MYLFFYFFFIFFFKYFLNFWYSNKSIKQQCFKQLGPDILLIWSHHIGIGETDMDIDDTDIVANILLEVIVTFCPLFVNSLFCIQIAGKTLFTKKI